MSSQPTPPPQPNLPPAQTPQQIEEELIGLRRQNAALSQMMWELVRIAAPETHAAEVLPTPSDPLWELAFVQSSDAASGKVRILAGSKLPITEQEKKRVVRFLRGTDKPMDEALRELKLAFPPSYVEETIRAHVTWDAKAGVWQSVTPPTMGEKARNFLGLPKS